MRRAWSRLAGAAILGVVVWQVGSDPVVEGLRSLDVSVLLLGLAIAAVTTVATAWSGYQAARWSGEQSQHYARASGTRVKAQQAATRAGQLRIDDLLYFNEWLDARRAGDRQLAEIYRRRFRPEFVPAFRAWLAQKPFTNPRAIAGLEESPGSTERRCRPMAGGVREGFRESATENRPPRPFRRPGQG